MPKRTVWSEDALGAAIHEVKDGTPVQTASTNYKIPRPLRNHLKVLRLFLNTVYYSSTVFVNNNSQ